MVRYIRDSDRLASVVRSVRRVGREANRPTGTEIARTRDAAVDAKDRADDARSVADEAAEDLLLVAQEAHDALVKANSNVAGIVVEYSVSADPETEPTSGWSSERPSWVDGSWVWSRTTTVFAGGSHEVSDPVLLTGPSGEPGSPGSPGTPGSDGRGIVSTEVRYQEGVSGVDEPSGAWLETVPAVAAGRYLWTRTRITYSDASVSTAFSVARIGEDGAPGSPGDPGAPGSPGADGRGVDSTAVAYASSASGTFEPSSGWQGTIPVVPEGHFLWTRTVITYTDSSTSTAFTVARMGADGSPGAPGSPGSPGADGRGIVSTEVRYQAGSSGTTAPGGTWQTTVPTVSAGQFLWTRTVTEYTSGSPSTSYSVGRMGENGTPGTPGAPGSPGADGRGVTGAVTTYQASNSGTSIPGGSWVANPPATSAGQYLWSRTITSYTSGSNTTAYAVARHGSTGPQGTSVSTLTRFYWLGSSQPAVPSASPPPAPWMTTEPGYTPGSTANLYEVTRTILSSGAWSYGPVSLSASFQAAKAAYALADDAKFLAEGLYSVIPAVSAPSSRPGGGPLVQGDQWWKIGTGANAGRFIGVAVWNGSVWQDRQIVASSMLVPGSVGHILLEDGSITTVKLDAEAIDGMTITGATIRTAPSGQRVQLDEYGLAAFNQYGALKARISPLDEGLRIISDGGDFRVRGDLVSVRGETVREYSGERISASVSSSVAGTLRTGSFASWIDNQGVILMMNKDEPGNGGSWAQLRATGVPLELWSVEHDIKFRSPVQFLGDTDWTPLTGLVSGVTAEYCVSNGEVEIWWDAVRNFPEGFNDLSAAGSVPAHVRPSRNRFGPGHLNSYPVMSYITSGGILRVVNRTGASRPSGEGTITYRRT